MSKISGGIVGGGGTIIKTILTHITWFIILIVVKYRAYDIKTPTNYRRK
jgi:hypothetical protein